MTKTELRAKIQNMYCSHPEQEERSRGMYPILYNQTVIAELLEELILTVRAGR
jgi:hypothetical protein